MTDSVDPRLIEAIANRAAAEFGVHFGFMNPDHVRVLIEKSERLVREHQYQTTAQIRRRETEYAWRDPYIREAAMNFAQVIRPLIDMLEEEMLGVRRQINVDSSGLFVFHTVGPYEQMDRIEALYRSIEMLARDKGLDFHWKNWRKEAPRLALGGVPDGSVGTSGLGLHDINITFDPALVWADPFDSPIEKSKVKRNK